MKVCQLLFSLFILLGCAQNSQAQCSFDVFVDTQGLSCDVACADVFINVQGGQGPYLYQFQGVDYTDPVITVCEFGVFTITVTDANGNESVVSAIVTVVNETLGIDDRELDLGFSVYPNPTKDILNLKIANFNNGKLSYQLFSLQGQLLLSETVNSEITRISMYRFSDGMYVLKVNLNNKEVKSFKIFKKE